MTALVRRLDNNDLVMGHGRRDYIGGAAATAQRVECQLRLVLGEWFLDTERGVPCFGVDDAPADSRPILGAAPFDPTYTESVLRAKILGVDGIATLTSLDLEADHNTRQLTVAAEGTTVDGDIWNIRVTLP